MHDFDFHRYQRRLKNAVIWLLKVNQRKMFLRFSVQLLKQRNFLQFLLALKWWIRYVMLHTFFLDPVDIYNLFWLLMGTDSISSLAPSQRRSTRKSALVRTKQFYGPFMPCQSRIFAALFDSLQIFHFNSNWVLVSELFPLPCLIIWGISIIPHNSYLWRTHSRVTICNKAAWLPSLLISFAS